MPSEPQMLFRRHFIIRPFESGDTICIQNCWIVWEWRGRNDYGPILYGVKE
uniref:Uncharacterized protein n=1 Tax=Neisseria meningitidis alpha153 TaxID=663926 RepID=C6SBQ1_NEIME|nr:hypothetical protein predicted by Glimmer/Critica [Neisseria meningitidis alpha153]